MREKNLLHLPMRSFVDLFDELLGAQKQQGLLLYVEQQPSAVLETPRIMAIYLETHVNALRHARKKSTPSTNAFSLSICSTRC
jgi:hypothetical protein